MLSARIISTASLQPLTSVYRRRTGRPALRKIFFPLQGLRPCEQEVRLMGAHRMWACSALTGCQNVRCHETGCFKKAGLHPITTLGTAITPKNIRPQGGYISGVGLDMDVQLADAFRTSCPASAGGHHDRTRASTGCRNPRGAESNPAKRVRRVTPGSPPPPRVGLPTSPSLGKGGPGGGRRNPPPKNN